MEHIVPQEMHLLQNTLGLSTIWLGCLQCGIQNKIITVAQYAIKLGFNTESNTIERKSTWPAPQVKKFPGWNLKGLNFIVYVMRKGQMRSQGFFWHKKVLFDPAVYNLLPLFLISPSPMHTHNIYVITLSSYTPCPPRGVLRLTEPEQFAELHVTSVRNRTWVWTRTLL